MAGEERREISVEHVYKLFGFPVEIVELKPPKRYVIVARNYVQARHYADTHEIKPSEWRYADPHRLDGLNNCVVLLLPGCGGNPHIRQIMERVDSVSGRYGVTVQQVSE